jgi:hypothetical protein
LLPDAVLPSVHPDKVFWIWYPERLVLPPEPGDEVVRGPCRYCDHNTRATQLVSHRRTPTPRILATDHPGDPDPRVMTIHPTRRQARSTETQVHTMLQPDKPALSARGHTAPQRTPSRHGALRRPATKGDHVHPTVTQRF